MGAKSKPNRGKPAHQVDWARIIEKVTRPRPTPPDTRPALKLPISPNIGLAELAGELRKIPDLLERRRLRSIADAESFAGALLAEAIKRGAFGQAKDLPLRSLVDPRISAEAYGAAFVSAVEWLKQELPDHPRAKDWSDKSERWVVNGCPLLADILESEAEAKPSAEAETARNVQQAAQGWNEQSLLGAAEWAERLGRKDASAVRKALERWRNKNPGSEWYTEAKDPGPSDPRYLYRWRAVKAALKIEG